MCLCVFCCVCVERARVCLSSSVSPSVCTRVLFSPPSHPTCPTLNALPQSHYNNRQVPGSYGMHDLNNYRSVLKGQNCTLHF